MPHRQGRPGSRRCGVARMPVFFTESPDFFFFLSPSETKRLSEQIAKLTERLDGLQQSVANSPAPPKAKPKG